MARAIEQSARREPRPAAATAKPLSRSELSMNEYMYINSFDVFSVQTQFALLLVVCGIAEILLVAAALYKFLVNREIVQQSRFTHIAGLLFSIIVLVSGLCWFDTVAESMQIPCDNDGWCIPFEAGSHLQTEWKNLFFRARLIMLIAACIWPLTVLAYRILIIQRGRGATTNA